MDGYPICRITATRFTLRSLQRWRDCRADYFLRAPFLLAAQRAFISWESLFRPAAVIPSFFLRVVVRPVLLLAFWFAQRARAAADNLARVAADILRLPLWDVNRVEVPPRIDASCLFKASICRRTETASCKALRDISTPI
jgi:hypothetical protein